MSGDLADRLEKLADERAAFVEEGRSVAGTWFEWPEHEIAEAEAESELLRSAAAALRREWRPIETAPKDGTPILVHALELEDPCLIVAEWAEFDGDPEGGSWVERWGCGESYNPTHWMPLPPPPDTGGGK